jgi:hypothetical protein
MSPLSPGTGWYDRQEQSATSPCSVRAADGDGRSTFWLLPGRLPADVREEMLTPVETHEQEMAAAQEDSDQFLRRIVEQYGDKPVEAKKRGEK